MRHIFGVTIKEFDYSDEIGENLKLDYLVLSSTANSIESSGDFAVFYVAVMNNNIAVKLNRLAKKYEHKAEVEMIFINPDYADFKYYMKMIGARISDMGNRFVIPEVKDPSQRKQLRQFAAKVGKRCLKRAITLREAGVQHVKNKYAHPPGLNWAYYGIIPD